MKNKNITIFFIIFQSIKSIKPDIVKHSVCFYWIIFTFIALNIIFFYSEIYNNKIYFVPYSLILLINSSIIAVNIHRIKLLNNYFTLSLSYSTKFKIYLKYLLFSIMIIFFDILISTIIISYLHFIMLIFKDISSIEKIIKPIGQFLKMSNFANEIFIYILQTPAHYVFSRLVLILPSIAINHNMTLKEMWNISKDNALRILILVHFLPWLYFKILSNNIIINEILINVLFFSCMNLIAMYIFVTITSMSYKYILK